MSILNILVVKFGYNQPIFVEDIKAEFPQYSRNWISQTLKRMTDSGELARFDTGVYYIPTTSALGKSKLSADKVIQKRFIDNGKEVFGFFSGLTLENSVGLTTQVPNVIEIVSNKESSKVRDIKVGYRTVRVRRSKTPITKDNVKTLQFLELIKNIPISELDEIEKRNLINFVQEQKIKLSDIMEYSNVYPAKAMKNIIQSGVINELTQ